MTEKYICVCDGEYSLILDTEDENYKTLEDFEKAEFKQAKKDGIDINEYEDAILLDASDSYWEWVYDNYLEDSDVEYLLNDLNKKNKIYKRIIQKQEIEIADIRNAKYKCPHCQKELFYTDLKEVKENGK